MIKKFAGGIEDALKAFGAGAVLSAGTYLVVNGLSWAGDFFINGDTAWGAGTSLSDLGITLGNGGLLGDAMGKELVSGTTWQGIGMGLGGSLGMGQIENKIVELLNNNPNLQSAFHRP